MGGASGGLVIASLRLLIDASVDGGGASYRPRSLRGDVGMIAALSCNSGCCEPGEVRSASGVGAAGRLCAAHPGARRFAQKNFRE